MKKKKKLSDIIVVVVITIIYPIIGFTILVGTCGGGKYLVQKGL